MGQMQGTEETKAAVLHGRILAHPHATNTDFTLAAPVPWSPPSAPLAVSGDGHWQDNKGGCQESLAGARSSQSQNLLRVQISSQRTFLRAASLGPWLPVPSPFLTHYLHCNLKVSNLVAYFLSCHKPYSCYMKARTLTFLFPQHVPRHLTRCLTHTGHSILMCCNCKEISKWMIRHIRKGQEQKEDAQLTSSTRWQSQLPYKKESLYFPHPSKNNSIFIFTKS